MLTSVAHCQQQGLILHCFLDEELGTAYLQESRSDLFWEKAGKASKEFGYCYNGSEESHLASKQSAESVFSQSASYEALVAFFTEL